MITTTAWVPRGFAAPFPSRYNFDEAEFERIAELAKLQLDDANDDLEEAKARGGGHEEDESEDSDAVDEREKEKKEKKENKETSSAKESKLDEYAP